MDVGGRYLGKRSHGDAVEPMVDRKRRRVFDRISEPPSPLEDVVYRILCPATRIGSVIGKGGSIIKSLRQETGAKIKVADGLPGAEERVIIISCSDKEKRDMKSRENNRDGSHDDKEILAPMEEDSILPPSQDALFKIVARIVDGDSFEEDDASRSATTRLLVPNSQIGCLLGKGGKIIEQMRTETGAQIRVLPREQLPNCAFETDELVQLSGDAALVKKALTTISARLYENPPRDRPHASLMPSGALLHHGFFSQGGNAPGQIGGPLIGIAPPPGTAWPYGSSGIPVVHGFHPGGVSKDETEGELVLRLLCPNDKIGGVIGKQGKVIRHIRDETCARIKISDSIPNADERVIIISGNESLHDQVSPTLEAVLQLQSRILEANADTPTRILVPSASIGCILGKRGSIITEMRRSTRANIRVLSKDALPVGAMEDDELIQVVGDVNVVRDAVIEIVSRLRANLFKEQKHHTSNGSQGKTGHVPSYEGRHEASPGLLSLASLNQQGFRSSVNSSRIWGLQGAAGGFSFGGSRQQATMFGSRTNTGLVTSIAGTTIEVSIPSSVIGSIIGKGGSNITQIRQISGAKVKLHDPQPGADKRIIEISGTPDQTQAAQSLLEAFTYKAHKQGAAY